MYPILTLLGSGKCSFAWRAQYIGIAMRAQLLWLRSLFICFCIHGIFGFDSQRATHAVTTPYMMVSPRKSILAIKVRQEGVLNNYLLWGCIPNKNSHKRHQHPAIINKMKKTKSRLNECITATKNCSLCCRICFSQDKTSANPPNTQMLQQILPRGVHSPSCT